MRQKTPLLILLIGMGYLIVAGALYQRERIGNQSDGIPSSQNRESSSDQLPLAIPTEHIVSNYKIYRNEKYGFEIRYPINWVLDFRICGGEKERNKWIYIVGFAPAPEPKGDCSAFIAVSTNFGSIEEVATHRLGSSPSKYYPRQGYKIVDTDSKQGYTMYKVAYYTDLQVDDKVIHYYIRKGNQFFDLGGFDEPSKFRPIVSDMLSSFTFLE